MAVTQALKADDAAAAAAAAQARRDASTSGSEPAQGVEEIWNQKQLAKVVGTMVASSVSIGQTRPLAAIESSVRIGDGMRAKFLDPCGGLGGWLQQHHGADDALRPVSHRGVRTLEAAHLYQARLFLERELGADWPTEGLAPPC